MCSPIDMRVLFSMPGLAEYDVCSRQRVHNMQQNKLTMSAQLQLCIECQGTVFLRLTIIRCNADRLIQRLWLKTIAFNKRCRYEVPASSRVQEHPCCLVANDPAKMQHLRGSLMLVR